MRLICFSSIEMSILSWENALFLNWMQKPRNVVSQNPDFSIKCKSQEICFLRPLTFPLFGTKSKVCVLWPLSDRRLTAWHDTGSIQNHQVTFFDNPAWLHRRRPKHCALGCDGPRACVLIWGRQTTVESCSNNLMPLEMNEVHLANSSSRLSSDAMYSVRKIVSWFLPSQRA